MALKIEMQAGEVIRFSKQLKKASPKVMQTATREWVNLAKDVVKETIKKTKLRRQSGDLFKALRNRRNFKAVVKKGSITITIRARNLPYGNIQEFGGTIKAKGKLLAIPLPPAKAKLGPRGGGPRDIADKMFVITSRAGNILLVTKQGGGILPMFVLKQRVKIPARLGLNRTAERLVKDSAVVVNKVFKALNRVLGAKF